MRSPAGWVHLKEIAPDGYPADEFYGSALVHSGDVALTGSRYDTPTTVQGLVHVLRLPESSGSATCGCRVGPCANADEAAGCANSTGAGALLLALGRTQPDEVSLFARGLPPHARALFLQGDLSPALPFGDGLVCLGGSPRTLQPFPEAADANGELGLGRCSGDPPLSSGDPTLPGSGTTVTYQLAYRDPSGPCASGFNLTNAVAIPW